MSIGQMLLMEFDHEVQTTRKFIERVPEDKLTWQPHEKSRTAGQLAYHIAMTPGSVLKLVQPDEVPAPDFNGMDHQPKTVKEILDTLEENAATVRKILPTISDERMAAVWKMTANGQAVMEMPRGAFLRSIMLNHWYHHRGQLGVYLRMLGAKVPSSYGPSADDAPNFGG